MDESCLIISSPPNHPGRASLMKTPIAANEEPNSNVA